MKRYIIPLAIAQVADLVTTWFVLGRGGYEVNPVAIWALAHGGLPLFAVYKLIVIGLAILIMQIALQRQGTFLRVSKITMVSLSVLGLLVVCWNILVALTL